MGKLVSLEEVSASVLPARVLVLLSKYAQAMRKHTGLVIKISSINVFRHVHKTHKLTNHSAVRKLYQELLEEVDSHIFQGTMHTNYEREMLVKRQAEQLTNPNSATQIVVPSNRVAHQGAKKQELTINAG